MADSSGAGSPSLSPRTPRSPRNNNPTIAFSYAHEAPAISGSPSTPILTTTLAGRHDTNPITSGSPTAHLPRGRSPTGVHRHHSPAPSHTLFRALNPQHTMEATAAILVASYTVSTVIAVNPVPSSALPSARDLGMPVPCALSGALGTVPAASVSATATTASSVSASTAAATTAMSLAEFSFPSYVNAITFVPQSSLIVAACQDYNAYILDTTTGSLRGTLVGHQKNIICVAYSAVDDVIATGGYEHTIFIWKNGSGTCQPYAKLHGHGGWVSCLRFSTTDRILLSGGYDGCAKMWNVETNTCIRTFDGHTEVVWGFVFTPIMTHRHSTLSSHSRDGTICVWIGTTGRRVATLNAHVGGVTSLQYSHTGDTFVSGGNDSSVRIWESNSLSCIRTIHCPARVTFVSFLTDPVALGVTHATLAPVSAQTQPAAIVSSNASQVTNIGVAAGMMTPADRESSDTGTRIPIGASAGTAAGVSGEPGSASRGNESMQVVVAYADQPPAVWDAATGALVRVLPLPNGTGSGSGERGAFIHTALPVLLRLHKSIQHTGSACENDEKAARQRQ